MNSARILILDDHPVVRFGLQAMILQESDMEVCGVAESASKALEILERETPDLIIVDLSLPDRSGLERIKQIQAKGSRPKILVNSMHSEKLFAQRALKAGASGYISKEVDTTELITAIRKVLVGGHRSSCLAPPGAGYSHGGNNG